VLRRNPGFGAGAILTIALGIGANTAVFTVVDETLFRSVPFAYGDRLVDVLGADRPRGDGGNNLTPAKVLGWQSHGVFERFEAYAPLTFEIAGDGEPEHVTGSLVTTGLFSMLGVGVTTGIAGSLALCRVLTGLLYEVSPYDPISFASVTLL
jgi:hypothetical protein